MVLERYERVKRAQGKSQAADEARVLRKQFGDIPLPTSDALTIQPLTSEVKKVLIKDGLAVVTFSDQTIRSQMEAGKPFGYVIDAGEEFENTPSMVGEVAYFLDPERFFIPGSNNKTLDQQEDMIEEFSRELRERLGLPDYIGAVIGQASDYTQLAFTHLDQTEEHLFRLEYDHNFARTKTPTSRFCVADVGNFGADGGLRVDDWYRVRGHGRQFVAPLVVSFAT